MPDDIADSNADFGPPHTYKTSASGDLGGDDSSPASAVKPIIDGNTFSAANPPQETESEDPILAAADREAGYQKMRLSMSLHAASVNDPDTYAKHMATGQDIGVPTDVVQRNPQEAARMARRVLPGEEKFTKDHPELASWLSDPENATVSQGDIPRLRDIYDFGKSLYGDQSHGLLAPGGTFTRDGQIKVIEQTQDPKNPTKTLLFDTFPKYAVYMDETGKKGEAEYIRRQQAIVDLNDKFTTFPTIGAAYDSSLISMLSTTGIISKTTEDFKRSQDQASQDQAPEMQSWHDISGLFNAGQRMAGGLAAQAPLFAIGGEIAAPVGALWRSSKVMAALMPAERGLVSKWAAQVVEHSVPTLVAMAPVNAISAIEKGQEHGFGAGVTDFIASTGIMGLTPSGIGKLISGRGNEAITEAIKKSGSQAVASSMLSEMGMQATQQSALVLSQALEDRYIGSKAPIDQNRLFLQLLQGGAIGGTIGALASMHPSAIAQHENKLLQADASLNTAERAMVAIAQIQQSKLQERAPGHMKNMLSETLDDGAGKQVYLQPGDFKDHWESQGMDPAAQAEKAGVGGAYKESLNGTGASFSMPVSDFLLLAAESKNPQSLVGKAQWNEGQFSAEKAAGFYNKTPEQLSAQYQSLFQTIKDVTENGSDASDAIHHDLLNQLFVAHPKEPSEKLDTYAHVVANMFHTLGDRAGVDPMSLYKQFPLSIIGDGGLLATHEKLQEAAAKMAADTAAGKTPEQQPLTDAVKSMGEAVNGLSDAVKAHTVESIPVRLEGSIKQSYAQPGIPLPTNFAATGLRAEWRAAHGGKAPSPKDKVWQKLVEQSRMVDEARAEAGKSDTHTLEQPARGSMTFGDGKFLMTLGKDSETSTVMHEMMHMWTEVMSELAQRPEVSQSLKDDYATMLAFSGYATHEQKVAMQKEALDISNKARSENRDQTPEEIARVKELNAPHEKLATAHEAYMMGGKAPSEELRSVFAKIKDWMLDVYKTMKSLGVELNPEITAVFDRLHASDEAIKAMSKEQGMDPVFKSAEEMGVDQSAFDSYSKRASEILRQAKDKLQRDTLREYNKTKSEEYKAKMRQAKDDETSAVAGEKDYATMTTLMEDEGPHGEPLPKADADGILYGPTKLNRQEIIDRFGKDKLKALPGPSNPRNPGKQVHAVDGMSLDRAAERYGYSDAQQMIDSLISAPSRKLVIADRVNKRMEKEYPEAIKGAKFDESANDAIHSKASAELDQEEAKALANLSKKIAAKVERTKVRTEADKAASKEESDAAAAKLKAKIADIIDQQKMKSEGEKGDITLALHHLDEVSRESIGDDVIDYRIDQDQRSPTALRTASKKAYQDAIDHATRGDTEKAADGMREAAILGKMAEARVERTKQEGAQRFAEPVSIKMMRAAAIDIISKRKVKDLSPTSYRLAEAKAARDVAAALLKGDYEKAFAAKQRKILNGKLYSESRRALEGSTAIRDHLVSLDRATTRERIGKAGGWEYTVNLPDGTVKVVATQKEAQEISKKYGTGAVTYSRTNSYLDQIDAIRERHELTNQSLRTLDRRESLREWVTRKMLVGQLVAIPESVLNDLQKNNWKELSVSKLKDIGSAVRNIERVAALKNRFLGILRKEDLNTTVNQMADSIRSFLRTKPEKSGHGPMSGTANKAGQIWNANYRALDIVRRLDGDEAGGAVFDNYLRPINEAADRHQEMIADDVGALIKIQDDWGKLGAINNIRLNSLEHIAEIGQGLSKWDQIMVAVNWGNEGNRERLMAGHKWNEKQVTAILEKLDTKDKQFVHDLWKWISRRRSEIGGLEERTHGDAPTWVEASPFRTSLGDWSGGYAPIVYDNSRSIAKHEVKEGEDLLAGRGGAWIATSHGHTMERTASDGRPLDLRFSVLSQHMEKVSKDLAWREALIDTQRILRHPDFQSAIIDTVGKGMWDQLHSQIEGIAGVGAGKKVYWEGPLDFLRQGSNAAKRAFNIADSLLGLAGLPFTIPRVGLSNWVKALGPAFSPSAHHWVESADTTMKYRNAERGKMLNEAFDRTSAFVGLNYFRDIAYLVMNKSWKLLDGHAWFASYYKALEQFPGDEAKARAIATNEMVATQGATHVKDQSQAYRGGPLAKIFTNNGSWNNANFALITASAHRFLDKQGYKDPKEVAKVASDMMTYLIVCPMIYGISRSLIFNQSLDDWSTPKKAIGSTIGEASYSLMAAMPLTRQIASSVESGKRSDQISGLAGLSHASKLAADLSKMTHEEWNDKTPRPGHGAMGPISKDILDLSGDLFHLPSKQIERMIEGWHYSEQRGVNPIMPMITGPPRK